MSEELEEFKKLDNRFRHTEALATMLLTITAKYQEWPTYQAMDPIDQTSSLLSGYLTAITKLGLDKVPFSIIPPERMQQIKEVVDLEKSLGKENEQRKTDNG